MTSQHGAYALHAGLARLHAYMLMQTPTRPDTHMHARAHRPVSNTYCFSTATIFHERFLMLRYTYIAPLCYKRDGTCLLRGTDLK